MKEIINKLETALHRFGGIIVYAVLLLMYLLIIFQICRKARAGSNITQFIKLFSNFYCLLKSFKQKEVIV